MSTSIPRLAPILVALFLGGTVVVAAPACGDDGETTGTGGSGSTGTGSGGDGAEEADVIYEGGATDEALAELIPATPTSNPAETASFTAPLPDTALPAAPPATFSWALPAQGSSLDLRPELLPGGTRMPGAIERAATSVLGTLLAGVPEAHAHGDPVNGRAYLVRFSTEGTGVVLTVFTTQTTYTPDDAAWTKLKQAAAPGPAITASITSAIFESNRIAADGGPFTGGTVSFTIAAE